MRRWPISSETTKHSSAFLSRCINAARRRTGRHSTTSAANYPKRATEGVMSTDRRCSRSDEQTPARRRHHRRPPRRRTVSGSARTFRWHDPSCAVVERIPRPSPSNQRAMVTLTFTVRSMAPATNLRAAGEKNRRAVESAFNCVVAERIWGFRGRG